ncbi:hypothetical protein [Actinoplanes sp. GCM10030250]|uniref:hypothetical protein n=1 Tax=Actinoplanes sp. GCM10030250 TaxID=3273376 RepID=UPI00360D5E48
MAASAITTLMTTGAMVVISPPAAQASPPFQGDCGHLTCTVRIDRAQTRNARDAGAVIGIAAGACGVFSAGTLAVVCGGAVAPAAGLLALAAARYYEQGDCLQIKFTKYPGPGGVRAAWPGAVKRGTRNCT